MNSDNIQTSDPHKVLLSLSDKTDLKRVINALIYNILTFTIYGKL